MKTNAMILPTFMFSEYFPASLSRKPIASMIPPTTIRPLAASPHDMNLPIKNTMADRAVRTIPSINMPLSSTFTAPWLIEIRDAIMNVNRTMTDPTNIRPFHMLLS